MAGLIRGLSRKVLRFKKSMYLLYHHITDLHVLQKPVKNGNKKSLKNQGFQGSVLGASKKVVLGCSCYILSCGSL